MQKPTDKEFVDLYRLLEVYVKIEEAQTSIQNAKYVVQIDIEEAAKKHQLPLSLRTTNSTVKISKTNSGNISIIIK